MSLSKKCNRCGEEKPAADFCARKDAPDGLDYRCRKCEASRRAQYTAANLEKDRARTRKYAAKRRITNIDQVRAHVVNWRKRNPDKSRENTRNRRAKYPEMAAAHSAATGMGKPGLNAHHWSYLPEHRKDVILLKRIEHARLHTSMHYDQDAMMYRTKDTGDLLATRYQHIQHALRVFGTQ